MGGFLEVNSFCCGVTNVEKGCKIIALFSLGYSLLIFFIASVDQSYIEVTVAYLLLLLTALLVYGVCEKIKFLVILYLVLRAVALALVLAEIMRSLGMRKSLSKDNWLLVFLELGDFVFNLYFWLVVFSFCRNMGFYQPSFPEEARVEYMGVLTGTNEYAGPPPRMQTHLKYPEMDLPPYPTSPLFKVDEKIRAKSPSRSNSARFKFGGSTADIPTTTNSVSVPQPPASPRFNFDKIPSPPQANINTNPFINYR